MATISRDNIGLLTDKLTVNVKKEDYLPAFEQAIKKYAKQASIPGFRKGMVPAGMIRKMHGPNVFTEEVIRTVEKELDKYMKQEKPDILAQPIPLENSNVRFDMNNPVDYEFAFEIGLKPAVNVDVQNITVTRHKVDITGQMVDDEIGRLARQFSELAEVEEVTTGDNVLSLSFFESDAEGNINTDGIARVENLSVKQFATALQEQLMGKKVNDLVILQLHNAFDENDGPAIIEKMDLPEEAVKNLFFQ